MLLSSSDLIKEGIESSYYPNLKEVRVGKLFEIAYMIYNKIGTIYGNTLSLPKQELAKVNYNLISRYLAYEDIDEEEDENKGEKSGKPSKTFEKENLTAPKEETFPIYQDFMPETEEAELESGLCCSGESALREQQIMTGPLLLQDRRNRAAHY